jgi:hypothetical protein
MFYVFLSSSEGEYEEPVSRQHRGRAYPFLSGQRKIDKDVDNYMRELVTSSPDPIYEPKPRAVPPNNLNKLPANSKTQKRRGDEGNLVSHAWEQLADRSSREPIKEREPPKEENGRRETVLVMSALGDLEDNKNERANLRREVDELKAHNANLKVCTCVTLPPAVLLCTFRSAPSEKFLLEIKLDVVRLVCKSLRRVDSCSEKENEIVDAFWSWVF